MWTECRASRIKSSTGRRSWLRSSSMTGTYVEGSCWRVWPICSAISAAFKPSARAAKRASGEVVGLGAVSPPFGRVVGRHADASSGTAHPSNAHRSSSGTRVRSRKVGRRQFSTRHGPGRERSEQPNRSVLQVLSVLLFAQRERLVDPDCSLANVAPQVNASASPGRRPA